MFALVVVLPALLVAAGCPLTFSVADAGAGDGPDSGLFDGGRRLDGGPPDGGGKADGGPDGGAPICGNSQIEGDEACDDGNQSDGDYCASDCLSITGRCGDGDPQANEECDDGNNNETDYCSDACIVLGFCGDGATQSNEACDDGNTVDTDECRNNCRTNVGCGNGAIEANLGEVCDDGNLSDGDYCSSNCSTITSVCGDGTQELLEACDDDNIDDGDYCSSDCSAITSVCGDGAPQLLEVCDDDNIDDDDYCSSDCLAITGRCGDNFQQGNEVCDDNNIVDGDYCSADCQTSFGFCGDSSQYDALEECDDGNNLNGDGCSANCFEWWDEEWTNRVRIEISNSTAFTQEQVPIAVHVPATLFPAGVQLGDVCAIALDDVTVLPLQIEDAGSTKILWVRLAAFPAGTTSFYLYGEKAPAAGNCPTTPNVFEISYQGVWHLNDNNAWGDATGRGQDLSESGNVSTVTGMVGRGARTSAGNFLRRNNVGTGLSISGELTLEAWVNIDSPAPDDAFENCILQLSNAASFLDQPYFMALQNDASIAAYWIAANNSVNLFSDDLAPLPNQTWRHIALTRTVDTVRFYLDGVEVGARSIPPGLEPAAVGPGGTLRLGEDISSDQRYLDGRLDEVRIASRAVNGSWIKVQVDTMRGIGTTVSPIEIVPAP